MEVKIRTPKITDHLYVMIGERATRVPLKSFEDDQLKEMAKEYGTELVSRAAELRTNGEAPPDKS